MQQPIVRVKTLRVGDVASVWQAAQDGDVTALQAYASAGSDLFLLHPVHRLTPLCLAVDNSQLDAVTFLLRAGANPFEINDRHKSGTNSSLFILSCMHGHVSIATALHTAIAAKGQAGRDHALHLNNDGLDALGVSMARVFSSLFRFHINHNSLHQAPLLSTAGPSSSKR
jgi:hypothetical protein